MATGKKVIKLVSGGIDSTAMAFMIPGTNYFIDYKQPYANQEQRALLNNKIPFHKINLSCENFPGFQDIYIDNRNLALASIAAMFLSPDVIYLAGVKDDNCPDKTPDEFQRMSDIISRYSQKRVEILSPFWDYTKGELVQKFLSLGYSQEIMRQSFSCYYPDPSPCYDCPACLRRFISLKTNGIVTPIKPTIINEYLKKIHTYSADRISRFFIAISDLYQITAIDIDGVLCQEEGDYSTRVPLTKNITRLNSMNNKKLIVLYTARLESDRAITIKWLDDHQVGYDVLIMNKLPFHLLVDDRSKNEISSD